MFGHCPIDDISPAAFLDYDYDNLPSTSMMFVQDTSIGHVPSGGNFIDYPGYDYKGVVGYTGCGIASEPTIRYNQRGHSCSGSDMFNGFAGAFLVIDTGAIIFDHPNALPGWFKTCMIEDITDWWSSHYNT